MPVAAAAKKRPRMRLRAHAWELEPVEESDSPFQLPTNETHTVQERVVAAKAMPKRRRANVSTSTEAGAAAGSSAGSATSTSDAPATAHAAAGSAADEMPADFARSCDELEAAVKPKNVLAPSLPRSDRASDEQAGAPTTGAVVGAPTVAPRPPKAMGERYNDEALEDPCRFAVDENLVHAQGVAATAHAQSKEPASKMLVALTIEAIDGPMVARGGLVAQRRRAHPSSIDLVSAARNAF